MTVPERPECDLDRARYQFQILSDTAAEIGGVRHPQKILESFLLSAQGGVGARGCFAAILGRGEFELMAQSSISRSLTPEYAAVLRGHLDDLEGERKGPYFVPALEGRLCPGKCEMLLVCPLDEERDGVLGLESSLSGRPYDEDDRALVASLGTLFQTSLHFSLIASHSEALNAELIKRSDGLDRQIFHLSAMRDLAREIIRVDMGEIMDTLLLTLLGHFGRGHGILLLYDRSTGSVRESVKGPDARTGIDAAAVERIIYFCLAGARDKRLTELQPTPVERLEGLEELELGFRADLGYLFLLRDNFYGVLLLGSTVAPSAFQDEELLQAFVSQGIMHLKNADSFGTITALNADLFRQNEELRSTIAELTRARDHISVLEAAGRRIAGIVHSKAESLARVRFADVLVIMVLSLGLALAFNAKNPRGIPLVEPDGPEIQTITLPEARDLLAREDALLIDARPREFYERGHAGGAVNVPAQLFDLVYLMQMAAEDPERPVVVYGRSISRRYDLIVARKFVGRDHERVYILRDVEAEDLRGGRP